VSVKRVHNKNLVKRFSRFLFYLLRILQALSVGALEGVKHGRDYSVLSAALSRVVRSSLFMARIFAMPTAKTLADISAAVNESLSLRVKLSTKL
jgi:hypothetical protein